MPGEMRSVRSFGAHLGMPPAEERLNGLTPLFVRVSFEARVETEMGEVVVVCGEAAQLGAWEPEHGVRMTTYESIYPIWRCEPLLLSEMGEIQYKFVIINEQTGEVRWEPLADNRTLVLNGTEVQVVAVWGSPDEFPTHSSFGSLSLPARGDDVDRHPPSPTRNPSHGSGDFSLEGVRSASGELSAAGSPCRLLVVQQHLPVRKALFAQRYLSIYKSLYLYRYISVSIYLYPYLYLSIYLSFYPHLSIYLSIYLDTHPPTHPPSHFYICIYV